MLFPCSRSHTRNILVHFFVCPSVFKCLSNTALEAFVKSQQPLVSQVFCILFAGSGAEPLAMALYGSIVVVFPHTMAHIRLSML